MSAATVTRNTDRERLRAAALEEARARDELVDHGLTNEPYYQAWERSLRELLDARGRVYRGSVYTQDGRAAIRDGWCDCGDPDSEEVVYEAFDDNGNRAAHGFVCSTCRHVTQTG